MSDFVEKGSRLLADIYYSMFKVFDTRVLQIHKM